MTDQPSTAPKNAAAITPMQDNRAQAKKLLRADIGGKWGKFTEQELTDLKDNDDLVVQLVAKYGLEKDAATRDAAAVVQGRSFRAGSPGGARGGSGLRHALTDCLRPCDRPSARSPSGDA